MMSPAAHSKPSAREPLIDAAEILFAQHGIHGASIADVALAVGISKANVMHHFPRKEQLYGAVLQRIATSLETISDGLPSPVTHTKSWLSTFCARYVAWAEERPAYSHILL